MRLLIFLGRFLPLRVECSQKDTETAATPFLSLKAYGNTPIEARGIIVELEVALVDIYEKGSIACVDIHEGDGGEGEFGQAVDHISIQ